jgi:uncharacterized protein YndB with AHSA1/START domain
MNTNSTQVTKDFNARSITVAREFDAPPALVWRAYTEAGLLDQWWGPAPWRAETKRMNFTVGGHWLYAMVSPEGERHWGRMNYLAIRPHRSIGIEDAFCDENGNINTALPVSKGDLVFTPTAAGTRVEFRMVYQQESDLRTIVEMGFEQGITACLDQLDGLLRQGKVR